MKKKCGLRMASGGLIEDKEAAWARRKAEIYASTGLSSKRREPEPEAAPAQPPAPAPAPQRRGGLMGAFDALTNRKRQIEEAAGYAQGGIVRGPGGPEDDKVPMNIAGKDVRLSNTEAVLPARTVQALGGPKAVEQLIEVTNGKPPVKGGLREGGRYYGGVVDDFGNRVKASGTMPPVTVNDSVTGQQVKPNVRPTIAGQQDFRANSPQPTPQPTAPSAAQPGPGAAQPGPTKPGFYDTFKSNLNNPAVKVDVPKAMSTAYDSGLGKAARWVGRGAAKSVAPIAAAGDVANLVDVATDDKMSKLDVGTEVARNAGRWASAGLGAKTLGAAGLAAGAMTGPLAPVAAPVLGAVGGLAGGVGGYLGADWLMDKLSGETTPSARSNGIVTQTMGKLGVGKAADTQAAKAAATAPRDNSSAVGMEVVEGPQQNAPQAIDPTTKLPVGLAEAAKANDGRANFIANMDATQYKPADGTGVITRAPGKDGLRSATFIGGPSAADAARDKQFAEAGYGKDAYGNWMTPGRIADQQKLAAIEAKKEAERPSGGSVAPSRFEMSKEQKELLDTVLTPHKGAQNGQLTANQINAARGIIADAQEAHMKGAEIGQRGEEAAARLQAAQMKGLREGQVAGPLSFRDQLELARFQYEQQKDAANRRNLQGNNERDYRNTVIKQNNERIEKWLDTMAPTQGLEGDDLRAAQQRRAFLQEAVRSGWGGNVAIDPAAFESEMPKHSQQAKATMALYDALSKDSGVGAFFRNGFRDATLSQQAIVPKSYDEKRDILVMPDGYEIPGKSVWGNDADIRAAILARMKQAAEEGKK